MAKRPRVPGTRVPRREPAVPPLEERPSRMPTLMAARLSVLEPDSRTIHESMERSLETLVAQQDALGLVVRFLDTFGEVWGMLEGVSTSSGTYPWAALRDKLVEVTAIAAMMAKAQEAVAEAEADG